mmetsp:Transcript_94095/g.148775  ORF Transcript_94095/g.148775 Transcript_94095/m.148775 type:complete len:522 (+) Transcript_94095:74-1639(+)|eukprot:CAMPEP_0169084128 /NCGR_PEP_ID=MMETSP1015-20121227/12453_1 /TAXON_ID=342587 /ORGANISM="Karlodinium micrum, Strain CCMP2283" /LENGTH=521 /DNA_ID=CAMNT_0009144111 /DNA_START=72 /DNA_END=1637 /DNA_ORIENTATION=+
MGCGGSGAQDAHGFASAVRGGYMPEVDTITWQGVFNEHFYDVGEPEKERAVATTCFPIIHMGSPWLAIFLKSALDGKPRNEVPIDLSVVIDISGSMGGQMAHCDNTGGNRLEHAKRGVEWLVTEVLRPDDAIAVSSFNNQGHLVQPLTSLKGMDQAAFLQPVRDLRTDGGTTLSAGMKIGRELLGSDFSQTRNRRILFLTDMGEMRPEELGQLITQNADDGVYVSIVAMGAEFNASLTEEVTKNRGSNYFCATNNSQLRQCLVEDFDFNMFPAAFDINVSICSGALEVKEVYGTPFDTRQVEDLSQNWTPRSNAFYKPLTRTAASQILRYSHSIRRSLPEGIIGNVIDFLEKPLTSITEVNTMFPGRLQGNAMKGGLILIRLDRSTASDIQCEQLVQVMLTYTDSVAKEFTQVEKLIMPSGVLDFMNGAYAKALSKGLLLQDYVQACREHMILEDEDVKKAALPDLKDKSKQFKSHVNADFSNDDKMLRVSENFDDFVKTFASSVGLPEDESTELLPEMKS